jgi:DNA-directed RNA polymerase subunit RPC12/RpoP
MSKNNNLIPVKESDTNLTEALECPNCNGYMKLDISYLDQVEYTVTCPYCNEKVTVGDNVYDEGCRPESDPVPELDR